MARYRVEHETRYAYGAPVSTSEHVACLRPRETERQRVAWATLQVSPPPARATRRTDYFGNHLDHLAVLTPHQELRVLAQSVVAVAAPAPAGGPDPAWEEARAALHYRKGEPARPEAQFAYASPYVAWDEEVAEYARASFPPGRPLLEAARELTHRIHQDFRYDAAATTITTPVRRVLHERRGVCQDFTHLQIACLRALGLSARYVSGYLLTDPPPGGERLIGADASHAWLALYVPDRGYVDLDPTNDLLPADRHVTVAWGRDFGDVSPLRGVILGGAEHSLRVGVSVLPLEGDAH